MKVVDSSAWIEWIINSSTAEALQPWMPKRDEWIAPTIIQLELAKWAYRVHSEEQADEIVAFSQKCVIVPLDSDTAIAAAALCRTHKLATADAIVYATALAHDAELLTCDVHFKDLPSVRYIEKRP